MKPAIAYPWVHSRFHSRFQNFVYLQKNTIFQKKGRPQGNGDKTDLRLFTKNTIKKKKAARRATGKKLTFVYLQKNTIFQKKKSRPQGNGDKKDLCIFPKLVPSTLGPPSPGFLETYSRGTRGVGFDPS